MIFKIFGYLWCYFIHFMTLKYAKSYLASKNWFRPANSVRSTLSLVKIHNNYSSGFNLTIGGNVNLNPCLDKESAVTSLNNFLKLFSLSEAKEDWYSKCPIPCKQTTYSANDKYFHKNSMIDPSNITVVNISESNILISLSYETLSIEEEEESLVYDVGNFLAAAGGNLGLFLGFSCFSVIISFFNILKSCYKRYGLVK